jgi:hypothetical protein
MMRTVLVALAVTLLLGACGAPGGIERTSWRLVEARDDVLELEVFAGHSSCLDYERVDVFERDDEVEIHALVDYTGDAACTDDYVTERVTVQLAGPLGDRQLTGCTGPQVEWHGHPHDEEDGCRG